MGICRHEFYTMICNGCPQSELREPFTGAKLMPEWEQDLVREAKRQGWKMGKNGKWFCPTCAKGEGD